MNATVDALPSDLISERDLSKLKWRCRRGLLENDLFIDRFFRKHGDSLKNRHAVALSALMDLSDNELLDLHLGRKQLPEIQSELDQEDVREVLSMLKEKP